MEAIECIKQFEDYFSSIRYDIQKNILWLDFADLSQFSIDLADELINDPENALAAARMALEEREDKKIPIRLKNVSSACNLRIRDLRKIHLFKLISMKGTIVKTTDVRPRPYMVPYECPNCGAVIRLIQPYQVGRRMKQPLLCSCGRKGKFKVSEDLIQRIDVQKMVLEEDISQLRGGEQPKQLNILLEEDLVAEEFDRKHLPGNKVKVVGIVKDVPPLDKSEDCLDRELILFANNIEVLEEEFENLNITPLEIESFKKLAESETLYDDLANSYAPDITGFREEKEGILCSLVGGCEYRTETIYRRGNIHVFFMGDPGIAKSKIVRAVLHYATKARLTGNATSAAGVVGAAVQDKTFGGWILEAGAMVLANGGHLIIDEMGRISDEAKNALRMPMEEGIVPINKASIHATLNANTSIIAASNPILDRVMSPDDVPISKQFPIPPAILSRFDLPFLEKDEPNEKRDREIVDKIFELRMSETSLKGPLEASFLKKYIAYVRQNIHPKLTLEVKEDISKFFIDLRQKAVGKDSIPITPRQTETLIRLTEAYAKLRMASETKLQDSARAKKLYNYCIDKIGLTETGDIDINKISASVTTSERKRVFTMKDLIYKMIEENENKAIDILDLEQKAKEMFNLDAEKVWESVDKLKNMGQVFEPLRGRIQVVK